MPRRNKGPRKKDAVTRKSRLVSREAALLAKEEYEDQKIVFGFEKYNQSECEVYSMDKKDVKSLTAKLIEISKTSIKNFRQSGFCSAIKNEGNYTSLFTSMPKGARVVEVKYSGAGRIFGYMVRNIFSVVAICKKHK